MSDAACVPDGDPCPRHGLPSRLLRGAAGLFSQCEECRADFLRWYASQHRHISVQAPRLETKAPAQFELGMVA